MYEKLILAAVIVAFVVIAVCFLRKKKDDPKRTNFDAVQVNNMQAHQRAGSMGHKHKLSSKHGSKGIVEVELEDDDDGIEETLEELMDEFRESSCGNCDDCSCNPITELERTPLEGGGRDDRRLSADREEPIHKAPPVPADERDYLNKWTASEEKRPSEPAYRDPEPISRQDDSPSSSDTTSSSGDD